MNRTEHNFVAFIVMIFVCLLYIMECIFFTFICCVCKFLYYISHTQVWKSEEKLLKSVPSFCHARPGITLRSLGLDAELSHCPKYICFKEMNTVLFRDR